MSRFWAGFGVATALWAAAASYLFFVEDFGPPDEEPIEPVAQEVELEEPEPEEEAPRRRRRRRRRGGAARAGDDRGRTPTGSATTGDNLDENEMRTLDMEGGGGEQQLSSARIDAAFDGAMGRVRRCLVLIEGDDPVRGRLVFGLRIAGSGSVERVQLSGPRAVTTGEAGSCLQSVARSMRFDSFDGPPMTVRYPITLE